MSLQRALFIKKSRAANLRALESSAASKGYYPTAYEFKKDRERIENEIKILEETLSTPARKAA